MFVQRFCRFTLMKLKMFTWCTGLNTHQLVEGDHWAFVAVEEPPGSCCNGRSSHVTWMTHDQVFNLKLIMVLRLSDNSNHTARKLKEVLQLPQMLEWMRPNETRVKERELPPMAIYLKKSQPEMRGSLGERGALPMMSRSGGLKPRAVAGRPSVTRLTHSSWTGIRASGRPRAAVKKILKRRPTCFFLAFWLSSSFCLMQRREKSFHSPDDLAYVGGDEVADELLHVVVDGSALLNSRHNGREVVVSQDHLRGRLGNGSARAHGDANLRFLQSGGIIHSVPGLSEGQREQGGEEWGVSLRREEVFTFFNTRKSLFSFSPWQWSHQSFGGTQRSWTCGTVPLWRSSRPLERPSSGRAERGHQTPGRWRPCRWHPDPQRRCRFDGRWPPLCPCCHLRRRGNKLGFSFFFTLKLILKYRASCINWPVIIMTRIPAALHSSMEPMTSLRGGSSMPTQPTKVKSV